MDLWLLKQAKGESKGEWELWTSNATKTTKFHWSAANKMKAAHPNNLVKSAVLDNPKYWLIKIEQSWTNKRERGIKIQKLWMCKENWSILLTYMDDNYVISFHAVVA